jgi:pyruvate/2-oxoglutarate dehydrogenase complex dihydrolipoamide dehydrogenase (E3) component
MSGKKYGVLVIGGGPAGLVAAKVAHGLGKRTLLVEKDKLGGQCTWSGCVPTKTMIAFAHRVAQQKKLAAIGMPVEALPNPTCVLDHVRKTIQKIYTSHTPEALDGQGIDVLKGQAVFVDAHTVRVGDRLIHAEKIIIGTGSVSFIPDIPGLKEVPYLTNENFFDLPALPQSIIVLGGGPMGIEFANALHELGVRVILVETGARILSREDAELSAQLLSIMRKQGIDMHISTHAVSVARKDGQIELRVQSDNKKFFVSAEMLLVAIGRMPCIEGLELEKAGVKYSLQGIETDATLCTTTRNIYAAGDCVGPYRFSHTAEYQSSLAAQNACLPFFKRSVAYQRIWVTFCTLEFAHLGMTEEEARAACGDAVLIMKKKYATLDRAITDDNTEGMVKVILNKKGYILGVHILGERAGELIHELAVAKKSGIRFDKIYSIVHAYPTYSELIWQLSKQYYVQRIQEYPLVRLLNWLRAKFGRLN